jgi:hypothetical protein
LPIVTASGSVADMTSSIDKERARRDEIEAAWVAPDPVVAKHPTTDEERPRTAKTILAAITAAGGFEIEEWSATVHDFPRWKTAHPDDPHLSYVAEPVVVYHLAALRKDFAHLAGVEVMYLNAKPAKSWVGVGVPPSKGIKRHLPVMQVAKTIREMTS